MHDDIKRYELVGVATSDRFLAARESLIKEVEDGMRDTGFVPVLDLPPQITRTFDPDKEHFEFVLSVYGTYVGEDRSWQIAGIMNGRPIERSTHRTK